MVSWVKKMYSLANKEEMYALSSRVLAFENGNPVDSALLRKHNIKPILMAKKKMTGRLLKPLPYMGNNKGGLNAPDDRHR
jgi:hypothetical protein